MEYTTIEDTLQQRTETWIILKNVGIISIAFMFYFTAFSGAANLQSSINADQGLGTASLALAYVAGLLSNMFLTSVVIRWLGAKWTLCCSFIAYLPFIICQMYSSFYTLVPAALIMGFGSATLFCAMRIYLTVFANAHSLLSKTPARVLLEHFFGFSFMIFQLGQIGGNLFSSLVLSINNNASATTINETMIPQICGANFLVEIDAPEVLPKQSPEKLQIITGVYVTCLLVSVFIIVLGLDSTKRYEPYREDSGNRLSGIGLLTATSKQMTNTDQLLFVTLNLFLGMDDAFITADFSASFVSCVIGPGSVGYIMMAYGISNGAGSFFNAHVAKILGRIPIIISALVIHIGLLLTMLLWRPHAGDDYILLLLALLWGICDSVWNVQMSAFYGVIFKGKEEAAFSNFEIWGSVGLIITYLLSSYVRTCYKIYLLLCILIIGITGYFIVEYRHRNDRRIAKEFETSGKDCNEESGLLNK